MVDMLHYSWSTEKLLDESFYFFCSFWSKSFVSFSRWSFWIWPSRCQTLSVKFVIIVKAQNVTPNIRLVMVILCKKDETGNCVWVEGDLFRFTHLFFLFYKYSLFIFILEYKPLKLCENIFSNSSHSINTHHFYCGILKAKAENHHSYFISD